MNESNTWPSAITFAESWQRAVDRTPHETFLIYEAADGTTTTWSYGEFDLTVARVANFLREHDVTTGSAVHLALANSPIFLAVWLATIRLGGWVVPSDPMGATAELAGHISRTRPVIGFCAADRAHTYYDAAGATQVVEVDEADTNLELFGNTLCQQWPTPGLRDRAAVMFTSGTTGAPKGVEITQANYAFAGATMAAAAGLQSKDRQLVVLPVFHANAQYYSIASAIWVGAP